VAALVREVETAGLAGGGLLDRFGQLARRR
jgi:hypothetical protein